MKKSLVSLMALMFVFAFGITQAAEAPAKEDPIAVACKDKKAGTEVTVDGKKVKCPKEIKKKTTAPAAEPAKKY